MNENIYTLDKDTILIFQELCQEDLRDWNEDGHVAFGVISEGEPAGLLMASVNEYNVWIDWIYVKPDYRNRGIANHLLNVLEDGLVWITLDNEIYVSTDDEKLKEFFITQRDMYFPEELVNYRFYEPIMDLIKLQEEDDCRYLKKLQDLNNQELKSIGNSILSTPDISVAVELPINPVDYLPESIVYLKDGLCEAALFLKKDAMGISVAYAYHSGKDSKSLFRCISLAQKLLVEKYGLDLIISITTLNKQSERLAGRLFPGSKKVPMWTGRKLLPLVI